MVGVLVVSFEKFLKFWSSSYSSNIITLITQNFVPIKLNTLLYWKELFVEKCFCKLSFLFANLEYVYYQFDEASKKNFIIVYRAYIYSLLFIILFSKKQKIILNQKWRFWRELNIWNKKYYRCSLMFKHIPVQKVPTFKTFMNYGMFVN